MNTAPRRRRGALQEGGGAPRRRATWRSTGWSAMEHWRASRSSSAACGYERGGDGPAARHGQLAPSATADDGAACARARRARRRPTLPRPVELAEAQALGRSDPARAARPARADGARAALPRALRGGRDGAVVLQRPAGERRHHVAADEERRGRRAGARPAARGQRAPARGDALGAARADAAHLPAGSRGRRLVGRGQVRRGGAPRGRVGVGPPVKGLGAHRRGRRGGHAQRRRRPPPQPMPPTSPR